MKRAEFVLALCGIGTAIYEGAESPWGVLALIGAVLLLLDAMRRA